MHQSVIPIMFFTMVLRHIYHKSWIKTEVPTVIYRSATFIDHIILLLLLSIIISSFSKSTTTLFFIIRHRHLSVPAPPLSSPPSPSPIILSDSNNHNLYHQCHPFLLWWGPAPPDTFVPTPPHHVMVVSSAGCDSWQSGGSALGMVAVSEVYHGFNRGHSSHRDHHFKDIPPALPFWL